MTDVSCCARAPLTLPDRSLPVLERAIRLLQVQLAELPHDFVLRRGEALRLGGHNHHDVVLRGGGRGRGLLLRRRRGSLGHFLGQGRRARQGDREAEGHSRREGARAA
eukprot:CAMPEP_0204569668 /NCGR_PEP_ID=MMETSP0661-20131031/37879_1 /ASSEMBLY_ACC=CAM_ASM_000606 /TAXON_ID=109239 /ORGANISM="Alexandrium margalefi, Strain AMGDE01CS-322" /LENGTH=107 /DNA_ID=CAMNT_0051577791 /DNA_START=48 /DNA_END=368 /DNA_ORIENTATION=+